MGGSIKAAMSSKMLSVFFKVFVVCFWGGGGAKIYFHRATKQLLVALHIGSADFELCSGACTLHQIEPSEPFIFHLFSIQS